MARYIEENEVYKLVEPRGYAASVHCAQIDALPRADVVEVKHGYWFISEYEYLNCSECGESYFTGADSTAEAKERLAEGRYYPYCPHCGAKMDAEPPKRKERKKRNA